MRNLFKLSVLLFFTSCLKTEVFKEKMFFKELQAYEENFEDETNFKRFWSNGSQNINYTNYFLESHSIRLKTNKGTEERVKIVFNKTNLTFGEYDWHVYVPKMKLYENCSIGAFLYSDNEHELDFEIGSGSKEDRTSVDANDNELLLFCSSQKNPYKSKIEKIEREQWYKLTLRIQRGKNNKYFVKWLLNDVLLQELQLTYGKRHKFEAYCSLENIHFIGDKPTTQDNYVLFDYFKFTALY